MTALLDTDRVARSASLSRAPIWVIIATAVLTGIVTLASNYVLGVLQSKGPQLTYGLSSGPPFASESQRLSIQDISIRSSGNAIADDVALFVSFTDASIKDRRVTIAHGVAYKEEWRADSKSYALSITSLNPGESIRVSLLCSAPPGRDTSFEVPAVTLRGKGVVAQLGEAASAAKQDSTLSRITPILAAIYAGLGVVFAPLFLKRWRDRHFSDGLGDRAAAMLFAYGCAGLDADAAAIACSQFERSFWMEADRNGFAATVDAESREKRLKALRLLTSAPNIASTSRAVLYYNIAKIELLLGHTEEANKEIAVAVQLAGRKLVTQRLAMDSVMAQLAQRL